MKSLSDLYQKKGAVAAPSAPSPAVPSEKAPEPVTAEAPVLETPPGLPQEYIDANLKNQPLPPAFDMAAVEADKAKPLNIRLLPSETMCSASDIPYVPNYEARIVKDRIEQGPRVFVTHAQRIKFEKDFADKVQAEKTEPKGPTLAHPDTLKPGVFITGESKVYRPG